MSSGDIVLRGKPMCLLLVLAVIVSASSSFAASGEDPLPWWIGRVDLGLSACAQGGKGGCGISIPVGGTARFGPLCAGHI